jgi:hypothetical protein
MTKLLTFDPALSPDERALFKEYARKRKAPHSIRDLKHHAESMLELHRPSLCKVYKLVKEGVSIRQIAGRLRSTPKTIKQRQVLAHAWLKLALVDLGPMSRKREKKEIEHNQLSLYEKVS